MAFNTVALIASGIVLGWEEICGIATVSATVDIGFGHTGGMFVSFRLRVGATLGEGLTMQSSQYGSFFYMIALARTHCTLSQPSRC